MTQKRVKCKVKSILVVIILIYSGLLITIPLNSRLKTGEAASIWTQTSDKDFDNGTLNNITLKGNGENTELKIDLSGLYYWDKKIPVGSSKPAQRYSHAMASIYGTDNVILFGGRVGTGYTNHTWIYDLSDNTWIDKTPTNPSTSNNPSIRYGHGMASIYGYDKVVLFGGGNGGRKSDTWIYDLSDDQWTNKMPSNPPAARREHVMATIFETDGVVLFGGNTNSGVVNDTWVYDLSANSWTQKMSTTKPSAREYHAMASVFGKNKAVLFGGGDSETWVLNLNDFSWTQKNPNPRPSIRNSHAMASIPGTDNILLFGGRLSTNFPGETWLYDLNEGPEGAWTKKTLVTPNNKPNGRSSHAMAFIYRDDSVVLFGGWDGSSRSDDTWIYKNFIYPKNGTYISIPFDTGSNSSFEKISWVENTPVNTSIKFQLRTAVDESGLSSQDFVGPNGSNSVYYNISSSTLWPGHNGDRWVQYKVYLNISVFTNSPSLKEVSIFYNCLPNTIVISPINDTLLTINNPTFRWSFEDVDSTKQKAFQVLIDDRITFENISFDSGEQFTTDQSWNFPIGTDYTTLPDGTWYWKVRTKDEDDAWTKYCIPWTFVIDTTSPTSAPIHPNNKGVYRNLNTISGISIDPSPGVGIAQIELLIKHKSKNYNWNGQTWSPLVTWLLANGTNNWTFDVSDITWTSGGQYIIQSRAKDIAGNIELPSSGNLFTIDYDLPTSVIEYPMDNIWVNNLDEITGIAIDTGGAGLSVVEISIQHSFDDGYWDGRTWTSSEQWLPASGAEQWTFNSSLVQLINGVHYVIHSRAIDNVNNIELPQPGIGINYDAKAPKLLSIIINDNAEFTTLSSVTLSLYAEDLESNVTSMSFSTDGEGWSDWEPFSTKRTFTFPGVDGEKSVYFRVQDRVSNIADAVFDKITLDTKPPEKSSILINNGDKYTNSDVVSLILFATDELSGVNNISLSYDGIYWEDWVQYKTSKFTTIPSNTGDGNRIVHFRVDDKAGNIAEPVSDTIILDTKPPESLSNIINDGANETNSTWVNLKLSADDSNSGLYQISFSDDNETWKGWEKYTKTKIYNLPPGDGEKTIYFRASDHAGNVAEPIASTILLNNSTPAPRKVKPNEKSSPNEYWLFIILIIFIVTIASVIVVITKRKKRAEEESLSAEAITIKPGGLTAPVFSFDQMPSTLKVPALPGTVNVSGAKQTTGQAMPTSVPLLAKSTQGSEIPTPKPTVQIPQLPQLPPAKLQDEKIESIETTQSPTLTPQQPITSTLEKDDISKITTPQAGTTPTVAQAPVPSFGPTVQLPDSPPPTTAIPSQTKPLVTKPTLPTQAPTVTTPTPQVIQQPPQAQIRGTPKIMQPARSEQISPTEVPGKPDTDKDRKLIKKSDEH